MSPSTSYENVYLDGKGAGGQVTLDRKARQSHGTLPTSPESLTQGGRTSPRSARTQLANPHTKPGCTWEKGTLMKQGLLFFDIPTLPLVHQGQLTVSHVRGGGLRTWERLLLDGRHSNSA